VPTFCTVGRKFMVVSPSFYATWGRSHIATKVKLRFVGRVVQRGIKNPRREPGVSRKCVT
jgi:hypothetical protein